MRAVLLIALFLLLIEFARHIGDKPQLAVDPVPAAAKTWREVWADPPQFCPAPLPVCKETERNPKPTVKA
jgi:hypothetical protein